MSAKTQKPVSSSPVSKGKPYVTFLTNTKRKSKKEHLLTLKHPQKTQILKNLQAVLEAAGSGLGKVVKINVYITDMRNFAEMNDAYLGVFENPQPVSQGSVTT
jgi:enamine deaminase RidA (YjgF/YER057c/UK114 family)